MNIYNSIKDNAWRIALVAGVGAAVVAGGIAFRQYKRKKSLIQDIMSSGDAITQQSMAKEKLKQLVSCYMKPHITVSM